MAEVILFGSLARGDWSARSDADVVVVVDERKSDDYAPRTSVGTGVDVFVYTREETEAWSPRFRDEIELGLVLYQRGVAPSPPT